MASLQSDVVNLTTRAAKVPPDKNKLQATDDILDCLIEESRVISSSESEESDMEVTQIEIERYPEFCEVKSKRTKRNANGDKIDYNNYNNKINAKSSSNKTIVDVSKLGHTTISQNRFELLGQLNIELDTSASTSAEAAKRAELLKNAEAAKKAKTNKGAEKNCGKMVRKKFCPPIILYGVNVKSLVDQLNARTPKVEYKIVNSTRNKSKIYFEDLSVHLEMMEILRENNVRSYSFTPTELRRTSVVLKGLYHLTDVSEIKSAIDEQLPDTAEKVNKLVTQYSAKNNYDTGLFVVTLVQGKQLNDINKIRYILKQLVSWEHPKSKKKEIQCFRCQLWGHSARNCNSKFKCVKCNVSHEPGYCSVIKGESSPICVNCNQSGHAANYRGCPEYKKYIKNKKELLAKAKRRKEDASHNVNTAITNSQGVTENISYASHFQSEHKLKNKSSLPPLIQEFLKLGEYFKESKIQYLEKKISDFLNTFKSLSLDVAKQEYLTLLKEVMSTYGP